jgi:hypothetical protein
VEQVLTGDRPDPAELHKIDWKLAAYWCRDCRLCYCRDDWQKTVAAVDAAAVAAVAVLARHVPWPVLLAVPASASRVTFTARALRSVLRP